MDRNEFKFVKEYQGCWCIPTLGDDIPGTLHIDNHQIRLELFGNNIPINSYKTVDRASGFAFEKDAHKKSFNFHLNELHCIAATAFYNGQTRLLLEVTSIIVSDSQSLQINNIIGIRIRTQLMDRWVSDYIVNCFHYDLLPDESNRIKMIFTPNKNPKLYKSDNLNVFISLGLNWTTPTYQGYNFTTRSFLNVNIKEPIPFEKAFEISEHFILLFSLLWNNNSSPEYVEYLSKESSFIYKQSDKYSYKYQDIGSTFIATDYSDFHKGDLQLILGNWIDLLNKQLNPINTLFETMSNEHMSPSTVIKNYVTVLDGLTEKIPVKSDGQIKNSKTRLIYDQIINKIESNLDAIGMSKDELTQLKNGVLRQTTKDISLRISTMLNLLSDYVCIRLEPDFCKKAINTRNFITHSRTQTDFMYLKNQYWPLSHCLKKLALSYILYTIGVKSEIARKIVRVISMEN
ncbi:MAG: hypothetical protein IKW84_06675 [Bacteroidaceae bacterium]|nr:hypothetical protein [Bacteroidaceae bacterium]